MPKSSMSMIHSKENTIITSGHLSLGSDPALSHKWLFIVIGKEPVITFGQFSHSNSYI